MTLRNHCQRWRNWPRGGIQEPTEVDHHGAAAAFTNQESRIRETLPHQWLLGHTSALAGEALPEMLDPGRRWPRRIHTRERMPGTCRFSPCKVVCRVLIVFESIGWTDP